MKTLIAQAFARLFCLLFLASAGVLHAQVPQIVSYQGRVAVGGVNFDGNGLFKFALVNAAGTTTHWSNDGTSVAGSEPAAAVSLAVTKGIYSVLLGDTALTNMTAIPHGVFTNTGVHLRVWFDDGVNGSQLLTPDQRIAAVGYAMMSATVHDAAITNAKIANGAVGTTKLAAGAVTSAQIAAGAVTATQLAANAVQSGNIAAGAVGATQIASGAVGFSDLAKPPQAGTVIGTGLDFDFGLAAFAVVFPQAFAAVPVVALTLVSSNPSFPSEVTVLVTSTSTTQYSANVSYLVSSPQTIDSTGDVGQEMSMAVVNGAPAMSYRDKTVFQLKYVRATNANGTAWGAPVTVEASSNPRYTSMAVVNGNPAISWLNTAGGGLRYVRATNANGTAWGAPLTVDAGVGPGSYSSLLVVNGNPAISAFDTTNGDLRYVRATDASGTAWGAPVIVDSVGSVGLYTSMSVVNGNPAISYHDATNNHLKYVRATDASGTAWGAPVTVDSSILPGQWTSLAVVNGNPAISYRELSLLQFVRATDANGTAWGTPVPLDANFSTTVFFHTSLAVVDGRPAVSYHDNGTGKLKYVHATDASGAAWGAPMALDTTGTTADFFTSLQTSLKVVNGSPAIGYYDAVNQNLKFIRQVDPPAFNVNWIALPP